MADVNRERDLVRELARQVAHIAAEPRMEAIRRRWRDVNALRTPDRAPVWCRPVGCWTELLPDSALSCRDPLLRSLEYQFRQILIKREIDDDSPVDPWHPVPAAFRVDPPNAWGVDIARHASPDPGGAWAYDPPLQSDGDFDRLRRPRFTLLPEENRRRLESVHDLLGEFLPPRLTLDAPLPPTSATLGTEAADLRGLEPMMLDMIAEPARMHRLMAFLRDAALASIDQAEATGLLSPNHFGPMTCSDPIGSPGSGPVRCRHLWCMANSQEFDAVSPAMWEEFCLEYQKPILARFGLVGYGCCENLTHKIDGVLSIPNLRLFTCSAWTDLDRVIETVGTRCAIMWRQKASAVVFPHDVAALRRDLFDGTRRLQGHYYQVVLRELQTLAGHPDRLHVWTALAKEAAARYA